MNRFDYDSLQEGSTLLQRVFGWMSVGLAITAGISYFIGSSLLVHALRTFPGFLLILFVAQFALVAGLSVMIDRLSYSTALLAYLLYSALNGITLSFIFLAYTQASILSTFIICASMFACMSLYGYYTQTDLSKMGSLMTMALFGMLICMLVNLFFQSSAFDLLISLAGVIIFTGLTAYDIQKIKALEYVHSAESEGKIAILGALTLYLDFINLFLSLLRLLGKKRD